MHQKYNKHHPMPDDLRKEIYEYATTHTAPLAAKHFDVTETCVNWVVLKYRNAHGLPCKQRNTKPTPKPKPIATKGHGNPAIFKKEKTIRIPPPFNPVTHERVWQPERRLWVEKRREVA